MGNEAAGIIETKSLFQWESGLKGGNASSANERRNQMGWDNRSVYDALLKRGNYEKKGNLNKYVSLDNHRLRNLNSVLYKSGSSYDEAPVHINKGRVSFSEKFFKGIAPALGFRSSGSHGWEQYYVIDWEKFAHGLGLTTDFESKGGKGDAKDHAYNKVKAACLECFKDFGNGSDFARDGNIIRCMKRKQSGDWPKDWVKWVVQNAGRIIKGVEIEG